ncbi:hypothetical protein, partial [Pseudomonas sp. GM18]|uniref:hypothetical protein n=1 Tax=Pseudomonas sp. GM18 TaxID=1144324 RepID=UPI001EE6881E
PALGGQLIAAGGADFYVTVLCRFPDIVSHEKDSSAINPNQPGQWARERVREGPSQAETGSVCRSFWLLMRTRAYLYIQAYAIKRPT